MLRVSGGAAAGRQASRRVRRLDWRLRYCPEASAALPENRDHRFAAKSWRRFGPNRRRHGQADASQARHSLRQPRAGDQEHDRQRHSRECSTAGSWSKNSTASSGSRGRKSKGGKAIDQAVDDIGSAVAAGDLPKAYATYRALVQSYPDWPTVPTLWPSMKQVSAAQLKAVATSRANRLPCLARSGLRNCLAAMPLAVQPVQGEFASAKGKFRFVVDRGTVFGPGRGDGQSALAAVRGPGAALPAVVQRGRTADRFGTADGRFIVAPPGMSSGFSSSLRDVSNRDVVVCDPVHQELLR